MAEKIAKLVIVAFCITTVFSCSVFHKRGAAGLSDICKSNDLTELYTENYENSLLCSRNITASRVDDKFQLQVANFILGENSYITGKDSEAFEKLLLSAQGPHCDLALASLSLIRELNLSYSEIDKLSMFNTSNIEETACRSIADYEKKIWRTVTGNLRNAKRIDSDLNFLKESEVLSENKFTGKTEKVKVKLPDIMDTLYFSHFLEVVENSSVVILYDFSFDREVTVPVVVKSDSRYKLFINGTLVFSRNEITGDQGYFDLIGEIRFSKGDYNIRVEAIPQTTSVSFFSIYMPDYSIENRFYSENVTGNKGTWSYHKNESAVKNNTFLKYIELISSVFFNNFVTEDRLLDLYSSILGSRNPAILLRAAHVARKNDNFARAESILKFISSENPDNKRATVMLMNILLDSNRLDELEELRNTLSNEMKESLLYRLFLGDYLSFRGLYPEGLTVSKETFHRFGNYPSASIYYAAALEEFGSLKKSLEERIKIINFLPYYSPVLESAAQLAQITGQLEEEIFVLQKFLDFNIYDREAGIRLGRAYLKNLKLRQAKNVFLNVLSNTPNDVRALLALGDIATLEKDRISAAKYYGSAYELAPDNNEAANKAALIYDTGFRAFFNEHSATDDEVYSRVVKTPALMADRPYEIIYDEGLQRVVNRSLMKGYFRFVVRLNNIEGVRLFSEITKDGVIAKARIIKKDGSISKNVKESLNSLLFYDLQPGDTVDYTYTVLQESSSWLDAFNSIWYFGQFGVLNRYSKISVFVPEEMKVHFFVHGDVKKEIIDWQDGTIHVFTAENVFLPKAESMMPRDTLSVVPNMQMSGVASWDDFALWQSRFVKEGSVVTSEMVQVVENIIKSVSDKSEIIEKLRDFVAREISYSFADSGIYLVKPERSDVTFNRKSGDCKDKALLLKVLLEKAGIKSNYTLVRSAISGEFRIELPYMQFDHAVLFIPEQVGIEKGFFVDPTASYDYYRGINPEIEGVLSMVIDDGDQKHQFRKITTDVSDSVTLNLRIDEPSELILTGGAASSFRFGLYSGESAEKLTMDIINHKLGASSIVVEKVDAGENYFAEPLKISFISESFFPAVVTAHFKESLPVDKRNYPLHIPSKTKTYNIIINGADFERFEDFESDNRFFGYSAVKVDNSKIKIEFIVKTEKIRPEEFAELKKNIIRLIEFEKRLNSETGW